MSASTLLQLQEWPALPVSAGCKYQRLYQQIKQGVLSGHWPPGLKLPSSRELASHLQLSRNTVSQAFEQLRAEGYLYSKPGSGYFVNTQLPAHAVSNHRSQLAADAAKVIPANYRYQQQLPSTPPGKTNHDWFRTGLPDLKAFPYSIWRNLVARHSAEPSLAGYDDIMGYWPLRQALAEYLQLSRGVKCQAQQIMICNGAQQALAICAWLLRTDDALLGIEQPGYPRVRHAFGLANWPLAAIAVDAEQGLDLQQLPNSLTALCITPAHQYPLGGIMPLVNRLALLAHAKQQGYWVIEDDYDAEFQYKQAPIPSLQGLADGQGVIFIGSLSKVMLPSLRLGYVVLPEPLVAQASFLKAAYFGESALANQAALADFIQHGHFLRHLKKMRSRYNAKRLHLLALIEEYLPATVWPHCQVLSSHAGMHLVLTFAVPVRDQQLKQALTAQGIAASLLSRYYHQPLSADARQASSPPQGLVMGFAHMSESQLSAAVVALKAALLTLRE